MTQQREVSSCEGCRLVPSGLECTSARGHFGRPSRLSAARACVPDAIPTLRLGPHQNVEVIHARANRTPRHCKLHMYPPHVAHVRRSYW